jgi:hypothetical protein
VETIEREILIADLVDDRIATLLNFVQFLTERVNTVVCFTHILHGVIRPGGPKQAGSAKIFEFLQGTTDTAKEFVLPVFLGQLSELLIDNVKILLQLTQSLLRLIDLNS